jgi:molybdopterin/thiamine biosynthesis adenylyltransferase
MTPAGGGLCRATVLVEAEPHDRRALSELRADSRIEFIDRWDEQLAELRQVRPLPDPDVIAEPKRWAYYPWRRIVTSVLGPRAFRTVRLDRNRNLITAREQARLGVLRVGIVGLSVGHAIAHTLAQEGLCGQLRLADFDDLELSNLNRVPAAVFDQGLNKATLAARRIAELDPYLHVEVFDRGVSDESVDAFLDGIDILVEECDSLDTKVLVRQAARERRIPVLMATGDRGLLDVERFDADPQRQILHGLLGDVDIAELAELPSKDKVPYALRMMDGAQLSPRMAASLVEVGNTLTTWPQLVGEVALSATLVAEAVRRIGLGEELASGRVRVDVAQGLNGIDDPATSEPNADYLLNQQPAATPADAVERVVAAAVRAPSGGNAQPWHVSLQTGSVTIALAPEYTSMMDVGHRASAVAVGAAAFNARVAAAADGILGPVNFEPGDDACPLRAVLRLADGSDSELAALYEPMLARETNRHQGKPPSLSNDVVQSLLAAAQREGGRLHLLTERHDVVTAAAILAESDRIRYLTPRLHSEMISELRWPGDRSQDSGIDVQSLELAPADLVKLDILRRPEVMACLAEWEVGAALGTDSRERILASSCVAVVSTRGQALTDYARGGSAVEAVWVLAQRHGLAVQPISPLFLYAHDRDDLEKLSPAHAPGLQRLRDEFRDLTATAPDESQALVLRFSDAPATSVRSQRRAARTSTLFS